MANVGVTVQEGVANGVTPFVEASKFSIGLLMERERGLANTPVMVTSLQEDRIRFGGITSDMYGAIMTKNLFNNAGVYGAEVHGVRIIDDVNSKAAFGILKDGSKDPLITQEHVTDPAAGQGSVDDILLGTLTQGDILYIYCGTDKVQVTVGADTTHETVLAAIKVAILAEISANPTGAWAVNYADSTVVAHVVEPAHAAYLRITGNVNLIFTYYLDYVSTDAIIKFWAGQLGSKDLGTWGNNLSIVCSPKSGVNGVYTLNVYYKSALKETFQALTWAALITSVNTSSYYIYAEPINTALATLDDTQTVAFIGGVYVAPVEADFYGVADPKAGLNLLDGEDVQIIANTEHHTLTMAQQGEIYATNRANCVYIANLPYLADTAVVISFATALQKDTPSFINGYDFWVKTTDDEGTPIWAPAIGCILGAGYVRTPNMSRGNVWIPPAGLDSVLADVSDITPRINDQTTINLYVQRYTTNVAVFRKGKGFFIFSSRTYSTNPLYHSIHVRRMTNWLVGTIKDNTLFAAQKPLTLSLRRELVVSLTMYMKGVYADGGLENSIPFEEACQVICDKTNNPPSQDRKMLNVDIQWIPVECTEAVTIRLNRNDGILIVNAQ